MAGKILGKSMKAVEGKKTRRVSRVFLWALLLSFALAPLQSVSQPNGGLEPSANLQEFEVATIKPHATGVVHVVSFDMPGRFIAINITARTLIETAYDLPEDRVSGGPHWAGSQGFDVVGKISQADWQRMGRLDEHQRTQCMRPMLQSLLKERFHLAVSHQAKRLPVYVLMAAKGGAKLQHGASSPPSETPKLYLMGFSQKDCAIAAFAEWLSGYFHSTLVDGTGLPGNYDINFVVDLPPDDTPEERDSAVLRALEDQLGLRLESRREPVDAIVITRLDEPSAN
jgi:uncharacterized protein (TIGR03435 family)